MGFQPINFAGIEPLGSTFARDFIPTLKAGYEAGALPQKLKDEEEERKYANIMKSIQAQYEQPKTEADIRLKLAQAAEAERKMNAPEVDRDFQEFQASSGLPREFDSLERLGNKYGKDSQIYLSAKKAMEAQYNLNSTNPFELTKPESKFYSTLPKGEKDRNAAYANGAGIPLAEMEKGISSGKTMEQIFSEKGIDIDEVIPEYPPTQAGMNKLNVRNAQLAEYETLESFVQDAFNEFAPGLINGHNLELDEKILFGQDDDTVGKVLAARQLQTELASIKNAILGGAAGLGTMHEMVDAALAKLAIIPGSVTTAQRKAMDKYVRLWLRGSVDAYNINLRGSTSLKSKASKKQLIEAAEGTSNSTHAMPEVKEGKGDKITSWEDIK